MKAYKKNYLIPDVELTHVWSMHCLCGSNNPTPDIQYSNQGASESGQTTAF